MPAEVKEIYDKVLKGTPGNIRKRWHTAKLLAAFCLLWRIGARWTSGSTR